METRHHRSAEAKVQAKVQTKFGRIEAEHQAKAEHRRELISWAKIASQANYRQAVYQYRRDWVKQVVKLGLANEKEAMELAAIKFKL